MSSAEWFLTDSGGDPLWALSDVETPSTAADAPSAVSGDPTGGTTSTINWTPASTGGTPSGFDVEYENPTGSANWVTAVGAANPTAGGAVSFAVTGQAAATSYTPRVRAKATGFADSSWTTGSPYITDNTGTGGGVIGAIDATAPAFPNGSVIDITLLTSTSYTATCPAATDAGGVTGYQWRLAGTGTWTDIASGGRVAVFTGRTPAATDALEMRARDGSGNFSAPLSRSVTLLGIAPAVTTQPSATSVVNGSTASFTAAFSGTPTPTVQWYRNGVAISGATSLTYAFFATLGDTGAIFTCTATSSAGSVTTNAATLTVTAAATAPSIVTQPASQTVSTGDTVTMSVVAAGTSPLAYQWTRNGIAISGATASSYAFGTTLGDSGATFNVVVTNAAGSVTSATATLIVTAQVAPIAFTEALNRVLPYANGCPDQTAIFHLQQAAIEFFQRTQAWKQRLTPINTVANQDAYSFALPANSSIAKILKYEFAGQEADVVDGTMGQSLSINQSGLDAAWTDDRLNFSVTPMPLTAGQVMTFQVALKPTQAATTLPSTMWEQYIQYIAWGALAEILNIPNQSFTNPARAAQFKADFTDAMQRVSGLVAKSTSRARQRTRAFHF